MAKGKEVTVRDNATGAERVYSQALHGKDYLAKAKEFAGKVSTREIVKATK